MTDLVRKIGRYSVKAKTLVTVSSARNKEAIESLKEKMTRHGLTCEQVYPQNPTALQEILYPQATNASSKAKTAVFPQIA